MLIFRDVCRQMIVSTIAALVAVQPAQSSGGQANTSATATVSYPMVATGWVAEEGTTFATSEAFPAGVMTLPKGIAQASAAQFSEGTIEFDMKPLEYSDTGVIFRRSDADTGEFLYLRANPDCPAANDCIQYAPITHGLMQWDIYPDHQGSAPLSEKGWNHLRLVVRGATLQVYVNRAVEPSLTVPRLHGIATTGGIAFKGPALFANLVVRPSKPGARAALPSEPINPNAIATWLAAQPTATTATGDVTASDIPSSGWQPFATEANGLANLSRAYGRGAAPAISTGWLKAHIQASAPVRKSLHLGWARQVSVFLNGALVYKGDNPYYPAEKRLTPSGRLGVDNAIIPLRLKAGSNDLVVAVGNRWENRISRYGWAAIASFDNLSGVALPRPATARQP